MTLQESIFSNHHQYYKNIGIETIKQQSGHIEQVGSDYQGRVIYELLQNAFDKADQRILVLVENDCLYIANDGKRFSYAADYDYTQGNSRRGDFQSLCSISTSTKNVAESIGNKGVGFKSSFSVAKDGFVNVYTNGEIIVDDSAVEQPVHFRIYEVFKEAESISAHFSSEVKENISDKLKLVHKERKDRGIPGYYFPLELKQSSTVAAELLSQGYVTVFEIPVSDQQFINTLISEIKKIHFQFIKIKYPNFTSKLHIDFITPENSFEKKIIRSDNFFRCTVNNEQIMQLALDAGIAIATAEIGVYVRKTPGGLLYNYLPTQVKSPFDFVDFHADFHTTVDRKSINFDGKVGLYNRALLKCCIEFYFELLRGQICESISCNLNLMYITKKQFSRKNFFKPDALVFTQNSVLFTMVQEILMISNYNYSKASLFLAGLGKEFFKTTREIYEHERFISNCIFFIDFFSRYSGQTYYWTTAFKQAFAKELKKNNVNFIPGAVLNDSSELLYRKKMEQKLQLPDYIGVNITDFSIRDEDLRKALGIKDFSDSNEVLKYFKQCSHQGQFSTQRLSEEEQKVQIENIFRLFEMKTTSEFLTTHRFSRSYTNHSRESNSTLNQANYFVSTIFLKTSEGRYKPAQLCRRAELDMSFFSIERKPDHIDDFLKFLGVSFDKNFVFADQRIYDQLRTGLDYIPMFLKRNNGKNEITADLISNFCIISDSVSMHPALLNNNDYKFLSSLTRSSLKNELDNLLVKNYTFFPAEYRLILKERLLASLSWKSDLMRLYQTIYKIYEPDSFFLVCRNNQLEWTEDRTFIIAGNKTDFDLCCLIPDKKVLCYYSAANLSATMSNLIVHSEKGKIRIENAVENTALKNILNSKILYILLSISSSRNSEINYLEDDRDLTDIQKRLDNLKIIMGSGLRQDIFFGTDKVVSGKNYAYDELKRKKLYFENSSNNKQIAGGISEFLFDNLSVAESLELILFHKDLSVLSGEFLLSDIATISKKWKKDFSKKNIDFQNAILGVFNHKLNDDLKWYIYNESHKSAILCEIDLAGRLEELYERTTLLKATDEFEGYFEGFELEIDKSHIMRRISSLKIISEQSSILTDALKGEIIGLQPILGMEETLQYYEDLLENETTEPALEEIEKKENEIIVSSTIERINAGIPVFNKNLSSTEFSQAKATALIAKRKKAVFFGNGSKRGNYELEFIGATGEEQVLMYFIIEFMKYDIEIQRKAIEEIYVILKQKLKIPALEKYRDSCLESIGNEAELAKSLIPFFYVTMHAKYAYFDLIVYKDNKPVLIEVKTTHIDGNNMFFLSLSEIDAARTEEFYEIVRVSPSTINFLGNPIKLVEKHLAAITGENFTITPTNYEFRIK